jgi:predicted RND superfamily exporter protein
MEKLGDFVVSYRKILLPVSTLIVVLLTIQIPKIELNDEFVKYFDYSIPFRADTEFMMDNLTGIYQIEYSLGAASADGVNDREYMQNLEKFSDWLRAQPEVVNVYSMIDIYKRLNKNMHGDDPDWYRIPDEKEMAAQYLLLYEFSLPYGLDLNDRINVDKSATRLTATLVDMSTLEMREFRTRAETWLKNSAPDYMYTRGTSPIVMFAYISERNINSMVVGNTVALFLISFCIMVALASIKIGLFSLIPNLIPPLMGFGIWAVLVGQVNMAGAITAAVSLGIIVDDTVHMLSKYFRARREKGYSPEDAVRYAFSTVGTALVVTTFILIIGFSVLAFSGFAINSILGVMTAIMIACALIADFFLLPPLLIMLDKDKKPKEQTNHA